MDNQPPTAKSNDSVNPWISGIYLQIISGQLLKVLGITKHINNKENKTFNYTTYYIYKP